MIVPGAGRAQRKRGRWITATSCRRGRCLPKIRSCEPRPVLSACSPQHPFHRTGFAAEDCWALRNHGRRDGGNPRRNAPEAMPELSRWLRSQESPPGMTEAGAGPALRGGQKGFDANIFPRIRVPLGRRGGMGPGTILPILLCLCATFIISGGSCELRAGASVAASNFSACSNLV